MVCVLTWPPVELFQNPSQQPPCPWNHVWQVCPSQWLLTMLIKCFIWPTHNFNDTPFKFLHRVLHGVELSPLFVPKRELFLRVIEKCCRRFCWTAKVAKISQMPNKHFDSGMSISFEKLQNAKKFWNKTFTKIQPTHCSKFVCSCHHKRPQNRERSLTWEIFLNVLCRDPDWPWITCQG